VSAWASDQFLNGTSAQTLNSAIHVGKYRTEDKLKTDTAKTKHNPEKANNTKHCKTKLAWFSHLIRHSARKRGGLILQAPEPTGGAISQ